MTARDAILEKVRACRLEACALPAVGAIASGRDATLAAFRTALARMGGRFVEPTPARSRMLAELFPKARVIVSTAPEVEGTRPLTSTTLPAELADVDVAVVRARLAVAETGSVLLTEEDLVVNALPYLAQHVVVLLDERDIVADIHAVYRDSAFGVSRYAVLMTGPSATADIEGVLVHGAQGPRSLTVVSWPDRARI